MLPDWTILSNVLRENIFNTCICFNNLLYGQINKKSYTCVTSTCICTVFKQMPLAVSPGKYMHCRCEMATLNFILINNYSIYDLFKPQTSRTA